MLRRLRQVLQLPIREVLRRGWTRLCSDAIRIGGRLLLPLRSRELSDRALLAGTTSLSRSDLIARMRSEDSLPSPIACQHLVESVDQIRTNYPDYATRLIREADLICEHTFDLLGSGPMCLVSQEHGAVLPWHSDFKTGYTWPSRAYYRDIRIPYGVADIKVPWELSRFSHAVTLGQAFQLTGNDAYLAEFVRQVDNWIDQNPAQRGVNWSCTMDVAIRAANWLVALSFFRGEGRLNDDFLLRINKSLLTHARHIRNNLENRGLLTNNHYLADLAGLLYLGVSLPWINEAEEWTQFAVQELESEILKQVHEDGGVFEASVCYHRLSLEMLASCHLIGTRAGIRFSHVFEDRLKQAFRFVWTITTPNGWAPQIGDNDSGRFHRLSDREELDFSYLLSWSILTFDERDWPHTEAAFAPEMIWLYGPSAEEIWEERTQREAPLPASVLLPDSGLCILRGGQRSMVISCGQNGQNDLGGHAHNDKLSFVFRDGDVPLIIDPGTYCYTPNPALRNTFRGTTYHNTLCIDGVEQNRFSQETLFSLAPDATVVVRNWQTTAKFDLLDVEHDGYARLKYPVIHRRQFFLDKTQGIWLIRDLLLGSGAHDIGFNLHLPSAASVAVRPSGDPCAVSIAHREASILFAPGELDGVSLRIEEGWISDRYGAKRAAYVAAYQIRTELPSSFWWFICPWTGEQSVAALRDQARETWLAHPCDLTAEGLNGSPM